MIVLHLLYAGGTGGIEKLCKDISLYSKSDRNIFAFIHEGGVICSEMKDAGAEVIELNLSNREFLKLAKRITEISNQFQTDCVVIHHPSPLIWLGTLLSLKKKGDVIVYAHNSYLEIAAHKKWKMVLYNLLLKKSSKVIAISEFVKNSILERTGLDNNKIVVVYNGIKVSDYKCQYIKPKENIIRLIYVGRLIREKGVQVLIEAMSKLTHKNDFHLTIVGDGDYRGYLETLVQKLDLVDIVSFEGMKRNVGWYFSNGDVFVHPAIWEEGFGITIVEAMSAGLICVAFEKGAIPEIIKDNVNGFLVKICESDALALQLESIRENYNTKGMLEIRQKAIERADDFSITDIVEKLHNIYMLPGRD